MKATFLSILCAGILLFVGLQFIADGQSKKARPNTIYQDGDIIFQSSNSRQCDAVRLATHSDISHCGMLFTEENKWYVLEAVEPVQVISLHQFIARGIDKHYSIKRLKPAYKISTEAQQAMLKKGKEWIGRHYDIYFNWSEKEIYCSELVWKLYKQEAKLELCPLKPLKSYDLNDNFVGVMMKERYGNAIPYDELMVAPSDIYASEKLELVEEK